MEDARRNYDPAAIIAADPDLARVVELLETDAFSHKEPGIFMPLLNSLRDRHDLWLTAADFRSYVDAQREVAKAWQDEERWTTMSIRNTASSGSFSSDRTIHEYAAEIWQIDGVAIANSLTDKTGTST